MPQNNDPWASFRKGGQPTTQPMPAQTPVQAPSPPPAPVRLPYSPAKVQQQQRSENEENRAETRIGLDTNQDARAGEAHKAKMDTLAANGGVDTNASQDQAAGHALNLISNLQQLDAIPQDFHKPGLLETGVSMLTDDPNILSLVRSDRKGYRQRAAAAQGSALESIIWLSTGAAVTEPQGKRFYNEIIPAYGDKPETLQMKRDKFLSRIAEARVRAGPANVKVQQALDLLEQKADDFYSPEKVEAYYGDDTPAKGADAQEKPETQSPWKDKDGFPQRRIEDIVPDPVMKPAEDFEYVEYPAEAIAKHEQWVRQNPNAGPMDYLNFRRQLDAEYMLGEDDPLAGQQHIEEYDPQEVSKFLQFYRDNPTAQMPPIFGKKRLSAFQKAHNWVAQSEAGNAVANFANARGFGLMEPLLTDKQRKNWHRRNMDSPWISTAADIAGSINPVNALSKGATKLGSGSLMRKIADDDVRAGARIAGNAAYGAIRGAAGAQEGERLKGAMYGGGLAAIGGVGGEAIGSGSRGFNSTRTVRDLDKVAGNKELTLLQRMGKGHIEEGLQGLPIVRGARQRSIEGFNVDNANRALKNIGEKLPDDIEPGFAANAKMNELLNRGYNKIRPKVVGQLDSAFDMATTGIRNNVMKSGNPLKVDLYKELQAVMNTFKGRKYDGNIFKDADQKLRQLGNDWRQVEAGNGITSPSTYHEMARVADKLRGQLRAQVSRNTPEVAEDLKKLDKAWAHAVRIENATNRAKGVYSPDQLMTTLKMLDTSKNRGAFARGKALDQDYAIAAENILGKAGSKETANPLQTVAGNHLVTKHPYLIGLPVTVGMTAAYTPGLNKIVKFLLTGKRPKALEKNYGTIVSQLVRKSQTEKED